MAIKMLNVEAADRAMATVNVGDNIEYWLDGGIVNSKVVDKTAFSVTVQGATNRLTIPLEYTQVYKQQPEVLNMAKTPLPNGAPAGRGRPRKSQAPAEVPSSMAQQQGNTYLPPGYTGPTPSTFGGMPTLQAMPPVYPGLAADVGAAESAMENKTVPGIVMLQPNAQPKQVTIHEAEGNENWARDSLEDALNELRDRTLIIIDRLESEQTEQVEPSHPKSCWLCIHVNQEQGKCDKFDCVPPMHVIAQAEKLCPDFLDGSSEAPF